MRARPTRRRHSDQLPLQARALADPTRYAIFEYVDEAVEPVGVAELTAHFGFNHNAIRQHLAKLRDAGLVIEEQRPPTGPGRPALCYRPTPGAADRWDGTNPYERLTGMLVALLIGFAHQAMGRSGEPILRGVQHLQRLVFRVLFVIMWAAPIGALIGLVLLAVAAGGGWYAYDRYYKAQTAAPSPTPFGSPTPAANIAAAETGNANTEVVESNSVPDNANQSSSANTSTAPATRQTPATSTRTTQPPARTGQPPAPRSTPRTQPRDDRTVILQ